MDYNNDSRIIDERLEVLGMLALQGYYDGEKIQTLETVQAKKNQKVIITVLDEFVEELPGKKGHSARGMLSGYANLERWSEEKTAWEKAVAEKYADA